MLKILYASTAAASPDANPFSTPFSRFNNMSSLSANTFVTAHRPISDDVLASLLDRHNAMTMETGLNHGLEFVLPDDYLGDILTPIFTESGQVDHDANAQRKLNFPAGTKFLFVVLDGCDVDETESDDDAVIEIVIQVSRMKTHAEREVESAYVSDEVPLGGLNVEYSKNQLRQRFFDINDVERFAKLVATGAFDGYLGDNSFTSLIEFLSREKGINFYNTIVFSQPSIEEKAKVAKRSTGSAKFKR